MVARHSQTGTHQYFYANLEQPFQLSAVRDPDGTFTAYYYDPYGNLFAFRRGTSIFYVASDHLGTPRVIADSEGTVVDVLEYDSYGTLLYDSNPTFKLPIGFAGGIADITGLIRFGFRDYEPGSGRWASRDPIMYYSRQANMYQYVLGDPINFLDRSGLEECSSTNLGEIQRRIAEVREVLSELRSGNLPGKGFKVELGKTICWPGGNPTWRTASTRGETIKACLEEHEAVHGFQCTELGFFKYNMSTQNQEIVKEIAGYEAELDCLKRKKDMCQ